MDIGDELIGALRPDDGAGAHVRVWRSRQGVSQLRVALDCHVSARHLSFVETGRAKPSRELILHLARRLRPSNRELSLCLLAAGYAPAHVRDDDAMVNSMLELMLEQHHPAPAFVFDSDWMMRRLNGGGQWLCSVLLPAVWEATPEPETGLDMIAALIHPGGLLSQLRDGGRVGATFVRQLRVEQLTNPTLGERIDRLEQSLRDRYPGAGDEMSRDPFEPALKLVFDTVHGALSFFTVQGVFGIPQHITVGSLRSELWFLADVRTRQVLDDHVPTAGRHRLDGRLIT